MAISDITPTGVLLNNRDWKIVEDEFCRVNEFTPMAMIHDGVVVGIKNTPYASVKLESPKVLKNTTGFITHRLDFQNLYDAFDTLKSGAPGVSDQSEIIIRWSSKRLRTVLKLFSPIMPRLWVMICQKGAYEILTKQTEGQHRFDSMPLLEWKPGVFAS